MKTNMGTIAAVATRISLGVMMFFAGLEKVIQPSWTAAGFLANAKTFPAFYSWFALPMNSWWVDPLNAWGIFLIGIALLLGVAMRPAGIAGAMLMILYYFPGVDFPVVPHGYVVEEHIIYAATFLLVAYLPEARTWSIVSIEWIRNALPERIANIVG